MVLGLQVKLEVFGLVLGLLVSLASSGALVEVLEWVEVQRLVQLLELAVVEWAVVKSVLEWVLPGLAGVLVWILWELV